MIETADMKRLLIETFDLEEDVNDIPDSMAIIGDGLELDSVDALEIVVQIEKKFKKKIKNEDIKMDYFKSVKSLTDFINQYN